MASPGPSSSSLKRKRRSSHAPSLTCLPREVLRLIAEHIYDPLVLTQQDRLTWGIFSTVDLSVTRTAALGSLINFGWTCRKVRREVKVVLFRCIRTSSIGWVKDVLTHQHDWGGYVKSIIIDLTMFDQPDDPEPRSCWRESALLIGLLQALPHLEHLSFFADQSDDSTLALLFATLIPHPSSHPVPPPIIEFTPHPSRTHTPVHADDGNGDSGSGRVKRSAVASPRSPTSASASPVARLPVLPLASRIRSFGWRQRSKPPEGYHDFSTASTFVSTLHLLRHAHRLTYLVLDADMDMIRPSDLSVVLQELYRRKHPHGEAVLPFSLILCGPIRGWEREGREVLRMISQESAGSVHELFIDRPLVKSTTKHMIDTEAFLDLLSPLHELPGLRLLQVGSYCFPPPVQVQIAKSIADFLPRLNVLALNGDDNDTTWWGIWRSPGRTEGEEDVQVVPLAEGDLYRLEAGRRRPQSMPLQISAV